MNKINTIKELREAVILCEYIGMKRQRKRKNFHLFVLYKMGFRSAELAKMMGRTKSAMYQALKTINFHFSLDSFHPISFISRRYRDIAFKVSTKTADLI